MKTIIKASLALFVLFSTSQIVASQATKHIMLTPNHGIELTTVVGYIKTYRQCMDNAQQQLQQHQNGKGRNTFNNARNNQCKNAHQQLKQSVNRRSLKSINKLVKRRWKKREVGPGFTPERILHNPTALSSGLSSGVNLNHAKK